MSKITQSDKNKACVRCGNNAEGVVCARHYNGFRSYSLGKGRGTKCDDLASARLCDKCDNYFSESNYHKFPGGSKNTGRSEEFLFLCLLSDIERKKEGVIVEA